jgi:hypothetical protein
MDSELRSGEMQMSWYGRRAWRSTRWGVVVGAVLAAGVVSPALAMGRSGGRVVNAPVRVARTAAGAIGFREVGRGRRYCSSPGWARAWMTGHPHS